jgi:hypothetical protein
VLLGGRGRTASHSDIRTSIPGTYRRYGLGEGGDADATLRNEGGEEGRRHGRQAQQGAEAGCERRHGIVVDSSLLCLLLAAEGEIRSRAVHKGKGAARHTGVGCGRLGLDLAAGACRWWWKRARGAAAAAAAAVAAAVQLLTPRSIPAVSHKPCVDLERGWQRESEWWVGQGPSGHGQPWIWGACVSQPPWPHLFVSRNTGGGASAAAWRVVNH